MCHGLSAACRLRGTVKAGSSSVRMPEPTAQQLGRQWRTGRRRRTAGPSQQLAARVVQGNHAYSSNCTAAGVWRRGRGQDSMRSSRSAGDSLRRGVQSVSRCGAMARPAPSTSSEAHQTDCCSHRSNQRAMMQLLRLHLVLKERPTHVRSLCDLQCGEKSRSCGCSCTPTSSACMRSLRPRQTSMWSWSMSR